MSHSRRSRCLSHSPSPSCRGRYSRSISRSSFSSCRSRSRDIANVVNPGNNLYVTGLSSRVQKADLEEYFSSYGKVVGIHLVIDPYTRESRGFGFITMDSIEDADRCIKYLDGSVLLGRVITVEKARRRRGRTPTPGRYLGFRTTHGRRHSPSYSPCYGGRYSSGRERSYSPYYKRDRRSPSPYNRSYDRSFARSNGRYYSPDSRSKSRSVSPYYGRRCHRSDSRSPSPRVRRSRRRRRRRSYSRSPSPRYRRRYHSRSISPRKRSYSRHSRESYSHSRSKNRSRSRSRSISSHTTT